MIMHTINIVVLRKIFVNYYNFWRNLNGKLEVKPVNKIAISDGATVIGAVSLQRILILWIIYIWIS